MPYHWSNTWLEPGAVIRPGNYGRIVNAAGYTHNFALRESVLEHVRSSQFPSLPSRMRAVFYFDTIERANTYRASENLNFVNLYEVEPTDTAAEARLDFRRVTPIGPIGLSWAEAYWRGDPFPAMGTINDLFIETLSETGLKIVGQVA